MITVKININVVSERLVKRLSVLQNPKPLLRPVAEDVLSMMTERIHEEGKAADGGQIGTYNNNYLKLRQGKKYNRTSDKKIIVSLTRRLENDWGVISTDKGYGIGFLNRQKGTAKEPVSSDKMKYVEAQKSKKIAALTDSERNYAMTKFKKLVQEALEK